MVFGNNFSGGRDDLQNRIHGRTQPVVGIQRGNQSLPFFDIYRETIHLTLGEGPIDQHWQRDRLGIGRFVVGLGFVDFWDIAHQKWHNR